MSEAGPRDRERLGCVAVLGIGAVLGGLSSLVGTWQHAALEPGVFLLCAAIATLGTVPHVLAILWLDRHEAEPPRLLLASFAWGAVAATGLAGSANRTLHDVLLYFTSDAALAQRATHELVAPLTEEPAKAIALAALLIFRRRHVDGVLDGIVYGALIGLGFAWFENIGYYLDASHQGTATLLGTAWARGAVSGIGTHATFTGLVGMGMGLYRLAPQRAWWAPSAGLLTAIGAHTAWNHFFSDIVTHRGGLTNLLSEVPLAVLGLQLPFLLLLAGVTVAAWRHEDILIRHQLAREHHPVVHAGDLRRLVPARRRLDRELTILLTQGVAAWWRHRKLTQALIELAFVRYHREPDPTWHEDEDAELLRLRRLVLQMRQRGTET